MWQIIFFCLSYSYLAESATAPPVTKCHAEDSKCLKSSAAKFLPIFAAGIPELNVETIDPMILKRIDATKSTLKLIVSDLKVVGLSKCEARKITRDTAKSKIVIKILCPANLEGKYVMDGQLFVLPIKGNGGLHVDIPKILIVVDVETEDFVKDGKKHWKVKSWKHSFDLKEKSTVKFDNLFPDNELLRTTTNELISNQGNDVITEIGGLVIKAIVEKVVVSAGNMFLAVPLEDLVLE